ncbi:2-hydroxyacid dehydrogenase [Altibacter sp. HG106]|uniref:2-hydroxyacid dehydrogenase n=1 Tax=Altibacter sp. HG106 TaxID=3023937 RepID=UPI002350695A|nr:2-hydroxyacid dehydrogenase [Altibacter sp. HG106]MDC7994790.1 2-hydroxyacid dehydrogenase [Altibacter sp. HG106]
MQVVHIDTNHPRLWDGLAEAGFKNIAAYDASKEEILKEIHHHHGIVIRSRFPIDAAFLEAASQLKFIARVGAGLDSIDVSYAEEKGVTLFSAPEGNRNAVGEHALGMLLSLFNKLHKADREVRAGQWLREANRGIELDGKTVGLIGYGNMGKAFAQKLKGFNCTVLCYDIQEGVGDSNATQVSLSTLHDMADVVSLHTPWTPETNKMVNAEFISAFKKPFWFINTARGKSVVTADLVQALHEKRILGAGLDVLEYEKSSFESLFEENMPEALQELLQMEQVLLSPHVAGWTVESKQKLAETLVEKIVAAFPQQA